MTPNPRASRESFAMVALPRPFEISSGEPFADVASTTPPNLAALVSEAWRAAGGALSRDPALALAPLRFLRGHRFAPPRWPPDAAPTLVSALDKAEECARASPSLANELWDTAAILLATWARWRSTDHPANVSDVRATLARVLTVVRDRALDARRHRRARTHHPRAAHPGNLADPAAAEPNPASELPSKLGPTPALVLACVAAAPPCDTHLRLDALLALVHLAGSDSAARRTSTTFSAPSPADARPRSLGDAQNLAAAFAYALSAAEALDAHAGVDGVAARARDVTLAFARTCRASGFADAFFAQRVGATLIAGFKTLKPKRYCPRAASAAAATARDALASSADGASADGASADAAGFAFVAGALASSAGGADAVAEDAMRTAVAMTIRITADDTLPDRVARAWTWTTPSGFVGDGDGSSVALGDGPGPPTPGPRPGLGFGFEPGAEPGSPTVDPTLPPPPARSVDDDVARFCAVAAFAVSARACLADRAYPTDAAFADASIRAAAACLRAPFALLTSLEDARAEPSAAAALVRLATLAPSASLAPSLLTLVATRLNESPTLRVRSASTTIAFASRFARRFHESYRGFKRRADPRWIAAMDPDAIRPAFIGVFRATIGFALVAPMTTARDVVAAAEAAAAVEFARAPDPRYAPALQRIANAMSADHPVARAARLAFVAEAFPDERELDMPVAGTMTGTGPGRVDDASVRDVGVAWRDDDVFGTRLHLLLRLLPFAAAGPVHLGDNGGGDRTEDEPSRRRFASGSGSGSLSRAMPTALRCVGHPRAAIARAAHVAHVAAFRSHPETHEVWFLPYLDAALERFPGNTPGEPFVAAVGAVAQRGSPGSRLAVEAARRVVRRAKALDDLASVAGSSPTFGPGGAAAESAASASARAREHARAAAATLRRLVFGLVALVDHELVPELRDACEAAVMGAGVRGFESRSGRIAAYEDLVDGVLAIGDYARKSDAVRWALRLRSRI